MGFIRSIHDRSQKPMFDKEVYDFRFLGSCEDINNTKMNLKKVAFDRLEFSGSMQAQQLASTRGKTNLPVHDG